MTPTEKRAAAFVAMCRDDALMRSLETAQEMMRINEVADYYALPLAALIVQLRTGRVAMGVEA